MKYKGKECERVGEKEVFGQRLVWVRFLQDDSFLEVPFEEIETSKIPYTLAYLRFIAIAAKIKDEVARKNILAPYRPHVIQ
jgi:hypothetical protein